VGPDGYDPDMYKDPRYKDTGFLAGMLVNGIPHGKLIGYIAPEGQQLLPNQNVPYEDVQQLGARSTTAANRDGVLWIAVNDAVGYLDDNIGYFMVTIARH